MPLDVRVERHPRGFTFPCPSALVWGCALDSAGTDESAYLTTGEQPIANEDVGLEIAAVVGGTYRVMGMGNTTLNVGIDLVGSISWHIPRVR